MEQKKIRLGFTNQLFVPGAHVCQIFNNDKERQDAMVNFLICGLENHEHTACFTENETHASMKSFFEQRGIQYNEVTNDGSFSLSKTGEVYFPNGSFEPENMISLLKEFYFESQKKSRQGARVIGEMSPEIQHIKGGSRLMEYEARVSILLREFPITAVCQYDARVFDGSTILDILKVHPYMIVRGEVVNNPFFIEPEMILKN